MFYNDSMHINMKNLYVKYDKSSENRKITSKFLYKIVHSSVSSQYLTTNFGNFISGFFPDFPDPVFSRNFLLGKLGQGQIKCHFVSFMNIFHILYSFLWWQKVADMKNAKNHFYLVSKNTKFHQNSNSLDLLIAEV